MADPIIEELWNAKDELAKAYSYDLKALANYLQEKANARKGTIYQGPRVISQDRSVGTELPSLRVP